MDTYKRIASDGKPIEVTDIPAGLSENSGVKNSIVQPVMARDTSRAGTEIYVMPQYKITYSADGLPEDLAQNMTQIMAAEQNV